MQGIQLKKNGVYFRAILLCLICISLLSFLSNFGNGSIMQDTQIASQASISACDTGKDAWQSIMHQNPQVDIFVQDADFSPYMQRLLSYKNNSFIATFCGLSFGLFLRTTPSFVSLSSQIPVYKIRYFLTVPHSTSPPYILA